jgi:hypothetical protein
LTEEFHLRCACLSAMAPSLNTALLLDSLIFAVFSFFTYLFPFEILSFLHEAPETLPPEVSLGIFFFDLFLFDSKLSDA